MLLPGRCPPQLVPAASLQLWETLWVLAVQRCRALLWLHSLDLRVVTCSRLHSAGNKPRLPEHSPEGAEWWRALRAEGLLSPTPNPASLLALARRLLGLACEKVEWGSFSIGVASAPLPLFAGYLSTPSAAALPSASSSMPCP